MTPAGIILAGGRGSRFAGREHKLNAAFRGRPLAAWALAAAAEARDHGSLSSIYVVTGAVSIRATLSWLAVNQSSPGIDRTGDDVESGQDQARLEDAGLDSELAATLGFTVIDNPSWAEGQATSLAIGVAQAANDGHDAVVVGLADQPFVKCDAWVAVAAVDSPIAIANFDGKKRPPVKLRSDVWPLLPRSGDEGARSILRLRPDLVSEVPCRGNPIDIDTTEDLQKWS